MNPLQIPHLKLKTVGLLFVGVFSLPFISLHLCMNKSKLSLSVLILI